MLKAVKRLGLCAVQKVQGLRSIKFWISKKKKFHSQSNVCSIEQDIKIWKVSCCKVSLKCHEDESEY